MGSQIHRIKRQILELKVPTEKQAQGLYTEISRIHHRRIAPLIDRCLTELSAPDHIYRIESLHLALFVLLFNCLIIIIEAVDVKA